MTLRSWSVTLVTIVANYTKENIEEDVKSIYFYFFYLRHHFTSQSPVTFYNRLAYVI